MTERNQLQRSIERLLAAIEAAKREAKKGIEKKEEADSSE